MIKQTPPIEQRGKPPSDTDRPPGGPRPSVGYAVVGLLGLLVFVSVTSGGSVPIAALVVATLGVGVGLRWISRRRRTVAGMDAPTTWDAADGDRSLVGTIYEDLSDAGREQAPQWLALPGLLAVVLGWAVIAVAVAVAISLVSLQLSLNGAAAAVAGMATLAAFLGILIAGPIMTLRWWRRRADRRTQESAPPLKW